MSSSVSGGPGLAVLVAALVLAAVVYGSLRLNHDTSWYLIATRKWLDGAELYRDIMEINPPLAFWLTAPAILLQNGLGLTGHVAFAIWLTVALAVSLFWLRSLLGRAAVPHRGILLVAFAIALLAIPLGSFGQREHLMLAFTAPYLTAFALRPMELRPSRREAILLGLFAALGFALKPHFLLAPLACVLVAVWRERSWRPIFLLSNLALGAACAAYAAAVAVAYPAYFEVIVPFGGLIYWAFREGFSGVLDSSALFLSIVALVAWRLVPPRGTAGEAGWRLAAVSTGFLFSYLLQGKGWNYQQVPALAWIVILSAWVLVNSWTTGGWLRAPAAIAVVLSIYVPVAKGPYRNGWPEHFAQYVPAGPSPRILVLSTNVSAAFPMVNERDGIWTSRYPTQWLLPGAVRYLEDADCTAAISGCQPYRAILDYARRTAVDDLLSGRPEVVFVDARRHKPYFADARFDYLEFLGQDPRFAPVWNLYRKTGETAGYDVWPRRSG